MRKTIVLFLIAGVLAGLSLVAWARSQGAARCVAPSFVEPPPPMPAFAPPPPAASSTALALLIDRSGSTEATQLEALRATLPTTLTAWPAETDVAVVSFSSTSRVDVPLTARRPSLSTMASAMSELRRGGASDLHAGLIAAERALAAAPEHAERRIVLIGDGHANHGLTAPLHLEDKARELAKAGIRLDVIASSGDAQLDLLSKLAQATGGQVHVGPLDVALRALAPTRL